MPPAWRSFLLSLLALLPVAILVFLWDCSFFVAWSGQAVSVAPSPVAEPASYMVRIHEGDPARAVRVVYWDATVVQPLKLPVDIVEMAPLEIPETAPDTEKSRFSLSYRVRMDEGTDDERWMTMPTTTPRSVGIAALVFLMLAALRNMVVAGSPIALERFETANSTAAPPSPSGSPKPPRGGSKKGPPPGKRRRGRGRR